MSDDNLLPFSFPAVQRKKITAAFDGGRITSDGGVMLLAQAERRLGIAERLAQVIPDRRDQDRVTHLLPDILRARIFAIACGYEDADDLDRLRCDPAFKLACGRLPDSGTDLCSQPTISRWENAPALRDLIRLMGVMVDLYCASYATPPVAVTLDIDDTLDVVHGHQQLALAFGLNPVMATLLGMLTGIGGGMTRDVLLAESPTVLHADLYAVAALAGAAVVVMGDALQFSSTTVTIAGAAICF